MRHAALDLILHGRFIASHGLTLLAFAIYSIALTLIPRDHPSRLYMEGRVRVSRSNTAAALRAPRQHRHTA